jgi:hypothetical protein
MKRLVCVLSIALGVVALAPAPVAADTDVGSVTGAASGLFATGAGLAGIALDGLELGTGVFAASDGSATGEVHVVLLGISALGQPQQIAVDGRVSGGSVGGDGSATFSGTATVDLGDGTLPFPGIPFTVTTTSESLLLTLGTSSLPSAMLTAGSITIE